MRRILTASLSILISAFALFVLFTFVGSSAETTTLPSTGSDSGGINAFIDFDATLPAVKRASISAPQESLPAEDDLEILSRPGRSLSTDRDIPPFRDEWFIDRNNRDQTAERDFPLQHEESPTIIYNPNDFKPEESIKPAPVIYKPHPRPTATDAPSTLDLSMLSSAPYSITLQPVHVNKESHAHNSTFSFTNTGTVSSTYSIEFVWLNGESHGGDGPFELNASETMDYDMENAPMWNFTGWVIISGDQPLTGAITSPDYGMITGIVYDSTSAPLLNKWVEINSYDGHEWYMGRESLSDGSFYAGGLPDGSYMVSVWTDYPYARQWYNGQDFVDDADAVTISGASTASGIDFYLQPGGLITGTVFADDGVTPLENINVDLEQGWFGECTDENGHYAIRGVAYGEHVIVAGRSWNWCLDQPSLYMEEYYDNVHNYDLATPITLGSTQDIVTGIDFTMDEGSIITGRVIEAASGLPLEDIEVRVEEFDNNDYDSTTRTDASGYYTITGLITDDYRIEANDNDGVPPVFARQYYSGTTSRDDAWRVTVGEDETVPDINFSLEPGGSISGRVVDLATGDPIPNINVSADRTDYSSGEGTCTDNDGNFVISSLAFGEYYIQAGDIWNWCEDQPGTHVREFYDGVLLEFDATPVSVDSGTPDATGIDFVLDTGGFIAGNVQDDSGQPISDLRIDGRIKTPDWNDHFGDTFTDENGDYLLGPLPEGEQFAIKTRADRSGYDLVDEFYDNVYTFDDAIKMMVTKGSTIPDIDIVLESGGYIAGNVQDDSGQPISDLRIDGLIQTPDWYENFGRTYTDENGDYLLGPLPEGEQFTIKTRADRSGHDFVDEFYDNVYIFGDATKMMVTKGSTIPDIDIVLETGGYITGNVQDDIGQPITELRIEARVQSSDCFDCDERVGNTDTDENGDYVLGPLPAGIEFAVRTRADRSGYPFVNKYYDDVYSFSDATKLIVSKGGTIEFINIVLSEGIYLTGHVSVPAGYSNEYLDVNVRRNNDPIYRTWTQTDSNGDYIVPIPEIYDDSWRLSVTPYGQDLGGGRVRNFNPDDSTNWDFDLEQGGTISGRITSGGAPVDGVWVYANSNRFGEGADSNSDGYYTIYNLPPGQYNVDAAWDTQEFAYTHYDSGYPDWHSTPVWLEQAQEVTGIDMPVIPLGQIEGYVYENDGTTLIEGIRISAMLGEEEVRFGYSQSTGYFTIDVPSGEYKLRFDGGFEYEDGPDVIPTYYPGVYKWSDASIVVVPVLDSSGSLYVVQNLNRPASMMGQVFDDSTLAPLADIHVAVLNVDPAVEREASAWDCTDETGGYEIEGIWPGENLVTAAGTCGNDAYNTITTTLIATPGESHAVDLMMPEESPPQRPFTILTADLEDYSVFGNGGAILNEDALKILPALYTPLVALDDEGNWYSDMLNQVPTIGNGGAVVAGDYLEVTYILTDGLKWSDGEALTSDDIRYTWEALTAPHPAVDDTWYIQWEHSLIFQVQDITTPDADTAVVTYKPGYIPPDYLSAIQYLLPEHALNTEHPLDLVQYSHHAHYPLGNGPYYVEDWVPGSHIDLQANPHYHDYGIGLPLIKQVRFLFTGDQYDQITSAKADVVIGGDPEWDLTGYDLDIRPSSTPPNFEAIVLNGELPYFNDPQVRKALMHALDRNGLAVEFANSHYVADGYLSPNHPLYTSSLTTYDFNLTTAEGLLDAAGWVCCNVNGWREKDGVEFEFDLVYDDGNERRQATAVRFQNDLASIGVDANLVAMNWSDMLYQSRYGRLDAYVLGWGYDTPFNPGGYGLFHRNSAPTGYTSYRGSRYTGWWQDATNDTMLEGVRKEADIEAMRIEYALHQVHWTENVPILPTLHWKMINVTTPILDNFKPGGTQYPTWNIQEWFIPDNPYDLAVRKSLSTGSAAPQPGNVVSYILEVNNAGYYSMTNSVLLDILPENVNYVSANPPPDEIVGDTLRWNLGDIPGYSALTPIEVNLEIPSGTTHGTIITNTAQVSANHVDTQPGNNGYIHLLEVREDVDVAVTKFGVGQAAVGEHYDYFIDYANWGGAPATSVVITDSLPAEVIFDSASPPPDGIDGSTLTWTIGTLPGNQWAGQIQINADIDVSGTLTNTAIIGTPDTETETENNSDQVIEHVDEILAPVILRPTGGTTDQTPTVSGLAPAGSTVEIYELSGGAYEVTQEPMEILADFIISIIAEPDGTFTVILPTQSIGQHNLAAKATKSGLTSAYSNGVSINIKDGAVIGLDPDKVVITSDGVDVSAGAVEADRYTTAWRMLEISVEIDSADAHLEVVENGMFFYDISPSAVVDLGAGPYKVIFHVWLGSEHDTFDITLVWDGGMQVRLISVIIDPDGYVYDQTLVDAGSAITDSLIFNGVVTAYVKTGSEWQIWPAWTYAQYNPQHTDGTTDDGVTTPGYYSFMTPSGQYRIHASAPGYQPYNSPVLTVITTPVHLDIGLLPISGGSGIVLAPSNLGSSYKTVDKNSAYKGEELTYDIWLTNSGDVDTEALTLDDIIPEHTKFVSGTEFADSGTIEYVSAMDKITWDGVLLSGQTVHIQFKVLVVSVPEDPYYVENNALVSGSPLDTVTVPELSARTLINEYPVSIYLPAVFRLFSPIP